MTIDRHSLRWNGWGPVNHIDPLSRNHAAWDWLADLLGLDELPHTPPVSAQSLDLPETRIEPSIITFLRNTLGEDYVTSEPYERLYHARGRSYLDLLHLRSGNLDALPDLVVYPGNPIQVLDVLRMAEENGISVVPFGGGSSLVGGVNAIGRHDRPRVITVDMTRMNRVLAVDAEARTAVVEAGIYGPDLERELGEQGFMLGHYPQSFEYSTLGGWIAARGAGQQSNRYGKPEQWVMGTKLVAPKGIWATECFPASAAGPSLTDLVVGSEGQLGIVTDATIRIRPVPEDRDYRGFLVKTFEDGLAVVRELSQSEYPVAMIRLSDPEETYFMRIFSQVGRKARPEATPLGERLSLRMKKYPDNPCLLMIGLEGSADAVSWSRARVNHLMGKYDAIPLGRRAGTQWYQNRFAAPFSRDPMLDRGLGIDTLETATRWSNIPHLYNEVRAAIEGAIANTMPAADARGIIMSHISHTYPDGASLYFSYVFPRYPGHEVDQWQEIKKDASEAIIEHGGTISHHHGVGIDHAPWMMEEKGPAGVNILRAVKETLDPEGVLNPGKMLPE